MLIQYNIYDYNTGNVNLTELTVIDNLTTVESHIPITFQSGQNFTGNAKYTITRSDYDNGSVTNLATALGFFDNTQYTTTNNIAITAICQNPALNLTKIPNLSTYTNGQAVTYTYKVTNIRNVTLSSVRDNDITIGQPIILGTTTLAPGANTTGTYTYMTTQTGYDNGSVVDNALAIGTFYCKLVNSTASATVTTANQNSALNLTTVNISAPITATNDTFRAHISYFSDSIIV